MASFTFKLLRATCWSLMVWVRAPIFFFGYVWPYFNASGFLWSAVTTLHEFYFFHSRWLTYFKQERFVTWRSLLYFLLNRLWHWGHENGLTPRCSLMCSCIFVMRSVCNFWQTRHSYINICLPTALFSTYLLAKYYARASISFRSCSSFIGW